MRPRANPRHRAYALACYSSDRSAPSRMQRAHDPRGGVDHQDRHAIGRENSRRDSRCSRYYPVALAARARVDRPELPPVSPGIQGAGMENLSGW